MMLEVSERAGVWGATPLYELEKTVFSSEQHTPLLYRDHLFAVLPKDAGENRAQLACLGLDGRLVWTSGKTERFGLGPFLRLEDRILVLADDGTLTLARASLTSYERLARARVLNGREAWAPMAWVDGRLLVRDFEEMVCLDLRAPTRPTAVAGKGS
jgi:outer membrane protein assembly factor BamB